MPIDQPVKLAFLSSGLVTGGAEIRLQSLIRGLRERGLESILVAPLHSPVGEWAKSEGVTHVPFEFHGLKEKNLFSTLLYLIGFRKLMKKIRKDHHVNVLYSNNRPAFTTLAFAPRSFARIAHHRDAHSSKFNALLYSMVDLNIFISMFNYQASDAPKNAAVILNAIDLVEPIKPEGYSGGTFRIAMFARITKYKGHDLALEAIRELVDAGLDCQLDIWGVPTHPIDHHHHKALVDFSESNGLPVRFLGFTSNVREKMTDYHLILNPSLREPFGSVPVEGFNVGIPVISHASGGPLEIYPSDIGKHFLFTDYSASALAESIAVVRQGMLDDGAVCDAILSMQDHVCREFSNSRVFKEVERAIREVVERKS